MEHYEHNGQEIATIEAEVSTNVLAPSALESMTRGEIDMQIATAKRYPRSLKKVLNDAKNLATLNEETAESCWYSLSRSSGGSGNKAIEGPSIRLAEIMASAWTNLRIGSMITDIGATMVTARGMVHDLETNVAYFADVQRRITNKQGRRFSDDMIIVTANAAAAIATRNAIIKAVPRAFVDQVLAEAKKVAMGGSRPLEVRRQMAIEYFQKAGITLERLLKAVDVKGVEDIGLAQLETLTGLKNQLKDGTPIDEIFPSANAGAIDRLAAVITPDKPKVETDPVEQSTAADSYAVAFHDSKEAIAAYLAENVDVGHLIEKLDGKKPNTWTAADLETLSGIYTEAKGNGIPWTEFFTSL